MLFLMLDMFSAYFNTSALPPYPADMAAKGRNPEDPFEAVSRFDPEEKKAARAVLDGLILRHQARRISIAAV